MKKFDEDILLVLPGLLNNIRPSFIKYINNLPQFTNKQVYLFISTWDIPANVVCLNNLIKEVSKDIIVEVVTFTYKDVKVYDYVNSFNKSILGKDIEVISSRALKMFMMHFCIKQLYKNKLWNSKQEGLVIKFKNNTESILKNLKDKITVHNKNFIELYDLEDKKTFYADHEMLFATRKNVLDKLYSDIDKGIYSYFSSFCTNNETNILKCKQEGGDQLLFFLLKRLNIKIKPFKFHMKMGNSYSPNVIITRDKVKQVCFLHSNDKFELKESPIDNFRVKYLGEIK